MTVVDRRIVTEAILTMLRTSTGMPVGDSVLDEDDIVDQKPWGVLHPIDGGGYEGGAPYTAPDSDAQLVYQVDSVGRSRGQAEWMADLVRRTMLARSSSGSFQVASPSIAPFKIIDRAPDTAPGGVIPEGEPSARVYSISERFVIFVTPS